MTRLKEASEYLRQDFTAEQRLKMGDELAQAHNRMADIESEESVIKTQIKERKAQVEQTISSLSRKLASGFEMTTVKCRLAYGEPNPMEVTYYRLDTGEKVKTRAMLPDEMQEELPLGGEDGKVVVIPPAQAEASAQQSAENITEFFGKQDATAADHPEPIEEAAAEADPRHDGVDGHCSEGCPCIAEGAAEATETALADTADDWAEAKPAEEAKEATASQPTPSNGRRKSGPKDLEKYHQEQLAKDATTAPRRPRGFDKPVNETAW